MGQTVFQGRQPTNRLIKALLNNIFLTFTFILELQSFITILLVLDLLDMVIALSIPNIPLGHYSRCRVL